MNRLRRRGERVVLAIETDSMSRVAAIAGSVDRELARSAQAPVNDFVALLVERDVRARLREDRAS